MELIIQPKDGLMPLVSAIKKATKQIDITIFRFDLRELQRALESAVTRGVKVHALIAQHLGRRAEAAPQARAGDAQRRRHSVAHRRRPAALPQQDFAHRSRDPVHAGVQFHASRHREKPHDGRRDQEQGGRRRGHKLFEADVARQPYTASHEIFSSARKMPAPGSREFIKSAKKAAADLRHEGQRSRR